LLIYGSHEKVISGVDAHTTNNRMELMAAVSALQSLIGPCRVDFYTDSEYLHRGITEWLPDWRRRGWKRKGGRLANIDLWQELASRIAEHEITWHWVKAHAGNQFNNRVDELARGAMHQIP